MNRNLLIIFFFIAGLTAYQPARPATSIAGVSPMPGGGDTALPGGGAALRPNLGLTLQNDLLRSVMGGLCETGYQIYLDDKGSYIVFRKLEDIRGYPAEGEVEVAMELDFSVKRYLVKYEDKAKAAVRLKFATVKKNGAIFLRGFGRVSQLSTAFGKTLDEKLLLPRINKAMAKGPLFELPMSEIARVTVPWPKLGESGRNTLLSLQDLIVEINDGGVTFHLTMKSETTVARETHR